LKKKNIKDKTICSVNSKEEENIEIGVMGMGRVDVDWIKLAQALLSRERECGMEQPGTGYLHKLRYS
jgi:hypothetical protein